MTQYVCTLAEKLVVYQYLDGYKAEEVSGMDFFPNVGLGAQSPPGVYTTGLYKCIRRVGFENVIISLVPLIGSSISLFLFFLTVENSKPDHLDLQRFGINQN